MPTTALQAHRSASSLNFFGNKATKYTHTVENVQNTLLQAGTECTKQVRLANTVYKLATALKKEIKETMRSPNLNPGALPTQQKCLAQLRQIAFASRAHAKSMAALVLEAQRAMSDINERQVRVSHAVLGGGLISKKITKNLAIDRGLKFINHATQAFTDPIRSLRDITSDTLEFSKPGSAWNGHQTATEIEAIKEAADLTSDQITALSNSLREQNHQMNHNPDNTLFIKTLQASNETLKAHLADALNRNPSNVVNQLESVIREHKTNGHHDNQNAMNFIFSKHRVTTLRQEIEFEKDLKKNSN